MEGRKKKRIKEKKNIKERKIGSVEKEEEEEEIKPWHGKKMKKVGLVKSCRVPTWSW